MPEREEEQIHTVAGSSSRSILNVYSFGRALCRMHRRTDQQNAMLSYIISFEEGFWMLDGSHSRWVAMVAVSKEFVDGFCCPATSCG